MNIKYWIGSVFLISGVVSVEADDSFWVVDQRSGCFQRSFLQNLSMFDLSNNSDVNFCSRSSFLDFHKNLLSLDYSSDQQSDEAFRRSSADVVAAVEVGEVGNHTVIFLNERYLSDYTISAITETSDYSLEPDKRTILKTLPGYVSVTEDRE